MGDRGNIVMDYGENQQIFFYTHWHGSDIQSILQASLMRAKQGDRLDDAPYLSRIIFCDLCQGEERDLTGFGITPYACDTEHPYLIVDLPNQRVRRDGSVWTFEEYIRRTDLEEQWPISAS